MHLLGGRVSGSAYALVISANNSTEYNIFTAASSPSVRVDVVLTIGSGIICCGAGGSQVAINTGTGWVAGSTILIINNGFIEGKGGNGNGGDAGDAMTLQWDVAIDNTNGKIKGGGGGGARGTQFNDGTTVADGGGGGGGQGNPGGTGGSPTSDGFGPGASSGASGARNASGSGGNYETVRVYHGGKGGDGGGWGSPGNPAGFDSAGNRGNSTGGRGKAINLNGHAVTWLGGFNDTQVLGPVS